MKRILLAAALAVCAIASWGATTTPVQLLNPAGSTAGQAILSTGASSAPLWGAVPLTVITGTLAVNHGGTGVSSASGTALDNITGFASTGFVKRTGAGAYSFIADPLPIANGGTGQTSASAALTALGGAPLASPTFTGTVTTAALNATTLNASGNDALMYTNTSAQSIPNNTATTITTWTKTFDRVNANFNASTGTFTAPATGIYQVSAQLAWAGAAAVVQSVYSVSIVANGATVATGRFQMEVSTTVLGPVVNASALVSLTAGQTIVIQALQSSGGAYALTAGAGLNFLSINRVP